MPLHFILASADNGFISRYYAWILLAYFIASALAFFAYGMDKRAAIKGHRRIPEFRLHALEALGGWPGALVAQHLFHHKTWKLSYQLVFWVIVLAHVAAWIYLGTDLFR